MGHMRIFETFTEKVNVLCFYMHGMVRFYNHWILSLSQLGLQDKCFLSATTNKESNKGKEVRHFFLIVSITNWMLLSLWPSIRHPSQYSFAFTQILWPFSLRVLFLPLCCYMIFFAFTTKEVFSICLGTISMETIKCTSTLQQIFNGLRLLSHLFLLHIILSIFCIFFFPFLCLNHFFSIIIFYYVNKEAH